MGIAESKEVLLVGRVIIGAGIGLASMSVPMYISESAPPNYRGFLVTCNNLVITGGQFFAACVCGFFSKVEPRKEAASGVKQISINPLLISSSHKVCQCYLTGKELFT